MDFRKMIHDIIDPEKKPIIESVENEPKTNSNDIRSAISNILHEESYDLPKNDEDPIGVDEDTESDTTTAEQEEEVAEQDTADEEGEQPDTPDENTIDDETEPEGDDGTGDIEDGDNVDDDPLAAGNNNVEEEKTEQMNLINLDDKSRKILNLRLYKNYNKIVSEIDLSFSAVNEFMYSDNKQNQIKDSILEDLERIKTTIREYMKFRYEDNSYETNLKNYAIFSTDLKSQLQKVSNLNESRKDNQT